MATVEGVFNNDVLEGDGGIVTYRNGDQLRCSFEDSHIHGFGVLFAGNGDVRQIGKFFRGVSCGLQWNFLEGGGFVVGKVSQVLPDRETNPGSCFAVPHPCSS